MHHLTIKNQWLHLHFGVVFIHVHVLELHRNDRNAYFHVVLCQFQHIYIPLLLLCRRISGWSSFWRMSRSLAKSWRGLSGRYPSRRTTAPGTTAVTEPVLWPTLVSCAVPVDVSVALVLGRFTSRRARPSFLSFVASPHFSHPQHSRGPPVPLASVCWSSTPVFLKSSLTGRGHECGWARGGPIEWDADFKEKKTKQQTCPTAAVTVNTRQQTGQCHLISAPLFIQLDTDRNDEAIKSNAWSPAFATVTKETAFFSPSRFVFLFGVISFVTRDSWGRTISFYTFIGILAKKEKKLFTKKGCMNIEYEFCIRNLIIELFRHVVQSYQGSSCILE